jgi:hypothetical protein
MSFPGGKEGGGAMMRLINQMPPHDLYVEPFVGGGAVLRYKRPAERSIACDLDPGAIAALVGAVPGLDARVGCGLKLLASAGLTWGPGTLVYCDPPYPETVCLSRLRYDHVMSLRDHQRLLDVLNRMECLVIVSSYRSQLYADWLNRWRSFSFDMMTRGGRKMREWVWCNFPEPVELHDYRYLGDGFREREKFRRQQKRWVARLGRMDRLQRQALLSAIAASPPGALAGGGVGRSTLAANGGAVPTAANGDDGHHRRKRRKLVTDCDHPAPSTIARKGGR